MGPRALLMVIAVVIVLALALVWGAPALIKEEGIVIEMVLSGEGDDLDIGTITFEDSSATQDSPPRGTHDMVIEIWETSPIAGGQWKKDILVESWTFRAADVANLDGQTVRVVLDKEDLDIHMLGTNYGLQILYDGVWADFVIFKIDIGYDVEVKG